MPMQKIYTSGRCIGTGFKPLGKKHIREDIIEKSPAKQESLGMGLESKLRELSLSKKKPKNIVFQM